MMLDCDDSDERWIFSEQLIAILTGHTPYKIIHKDLEIIDSESKSGKFGITKRSLTLQSTFTISIKFFLRFLKIFSCQLVNQTKVSFLVHHKSL